MSIKIEGLYSYPIKSCAGVKHEIADVTERGLHGDRFFMVADENGNFLSQREYPKLALIQPEVIEYDAETIMAMDVNAPGMETLEVGHEQGIPSRYDQVRTKVHSSTVWGLEVDRDADEWFSEYLGRPAQLVATNINHWRFIKDRYSVTGASNVAAFADAFPMLLASQASLDELNRQIKDSTGGAAVGMDRFRPNIVVNGEDLEPYDEDYWQKVRVGQMLAYVVRPCKRCAIPYVNQETGIKSDAKTVGKALAVTRRGYDMTSPNDNGAGVFFAQNLNHFSEASLSLREGEEVVILDRSESPNVRLR